MANSSSSIKTVDTILSATWILPIVPHQQILNSHALVIDQGLILDILPLHLVNQTYRSQDQRHLEQHLLMPGLINAHGHAAMSLLRGYADDIPLMEWLEQHIWPIEGQFVNADFVYQGTQVAIAEMLRSGTTCYSDMYLFPNQSALAAKKAGMRTQIAFPIFDVPSAWGKNADEYISKGLDLNDVYADDSLINVAFGPHAPYSNSDKTLTRVATLASELDSAIQIHVHETATEVAQALAQYGERPLRRLQRLGLLSPTLQAVHCTQLDSSDIELLQTYQSHIIHCPESNLKLASGYCPSAQLVAQKINVAIGTDGAASNNDLDMFSELRSAALIAKAQSQDSRVISATKALEMATIDGARALGIDHQVGSLEKGKEADVIALNLHRLEAQPIHQIQSLLSYSNCAAWVEHVWVQGRQLLKNRELCTLDEHELLAQCHAWQKKLRR